MLLPPSAASAWTVASLNAIHDSSAHLTRAGYFATPANATPSSSTASSGSTWPRDADHLGERVHRGQRLVDRLADHQLVQHAGRGLADRAAHALVRDVGDLAVDEVHPQVDLVATGRVDVADLRLVRLPQAAPARLLVVVQDDLLVELRRAASAEHLPHLVQRRAPARRSPRSCCKGTATPGSSPARRTVRRSAGRSGGRPGPGRPRRRAPGPTSCGWMPARSNEIVPPRPTGIGGPKMRRPGTVGSASSAYAVSSFSCHWIGVHADRGEVVDRGAEPDRLGDRRGARLEPGRRRGERRAAPS